jgi:hypothetical protein
MRLGQELRMHHSRINRIVTVTALSCAAVCLLEPSAFARGGLGGTVCPNPGGPDMIIGDISGVGNYAAQQINGEWFDAFSFGQTHCNIGDANLMFEAFPSNQHPVFAPSLYKMKNGRIEQIGIGWLQHGFFALAANSCGCGCNGELGDVLGVGCSDSNSAGLAGSPTGLGPRWQVNAHTGFFPSPAPANPPFNGTVARRVRVRSAELEPSSGGAQYFAEYLHVSAQEALFGKQNNNASYRPVTITGSSNDFLVATAGAINREHSAIRAWKISDPAVVETDIQIPDEGLFILAAKAVQLSKDTWHYEYALANVNSDLSGQAFSVPLPPGAVITNVGFHDVDYHSGDAMNNFSDGSLNFNGADWEVEISGDSIQWSSETLAQNINANALRWGTMYNFRFDANKPPVSDTKGSMVTLATYKAEGSIDALSVVPGAASCVGDVAPFPGLPNGAIDVDDLMLVINLWGQCVPGSCPADANGDGAVDVDDLLAVINAWGPC